MAQNDNAVLTPAVGYIFVAPVDTAAPTPSAISGFDPVTGFAGYESLGHTARDELPNFGFDGGDTEVKGTWQNSSFKEVVTEVATDYVTFNLHQFDEMALSLYYGVTNPGSTEGVFEVQQAATAPIEKALLIVIVDGDASIGFHASRAGVRREDGIELSVEDFAMLPLRATFLKSTGKPLFSWISEDTGVNVS